MELYLKDKVILYTGAAGLIGSAACEQIASKGGKLVLIDNDIKKLDLLTNKLSNLISNGSNILKFSDVSLLNYKEIDFMLDTILEKFGKIDCLINSAYPRTIDWSFKFEDINFESWQKNVNEHMNSYFLVSQRTSLKMIEQKYGNIINFSSIYGLLGPNFNVYQSSDEMTMPAAYSAIKGGISNFTRYMASYLGKYNIRVNAICPGGVKNNQNEKFIESYESIVPLGKMASVEDIVAPLLFLISDLSSYITGVNLPVDGGWTAI